ncbi:hypothetical protein LTR40_011617 [Exophiala xenobiotica]|nr:hypothetical protein LTR40_011617 [Exophiala xenobiotica]
MYMLHVFPPILSILVHALLIALYTVSVDYQASSDTTDPDHPQNGPPWQQREEYAEQKRLKAEKWARFDSLEDPNTGEAMAYPMPETPGAQRGLNPMTPRTMAFNTLGGTKDLPLRNHFSTPNAPTSPTYALRSPDLPRSPMSPSFVDRVGSDIQAGKSPEIGTSRSPTSAAPQLYFPPPPKTSKK